MKIGIIGSRRFLNKTSIKNTIDKLPNNSVIVSGGAKGPDLWAEKAAQSRNLKTMIFLPNLPPKNSPKHEFTKAYYERNRKIAEHSDIIHAFIAIDRKGGTEYTINYAKKLGKPIVIHTS